MSSVQTGRQAEQAAADYLEAAGFQVVDRNWRTRYCEIDIIATKGTAAYFVEVKYRHRSNQGTGLDYVTPRKLRQMEFAASMWVQANDWTGDYFLGAIEISGQNFTVSRFLPDCLA